MFNASGGFLITACFSMGASSPLKNLAVLQRYPVFFLSRQDTPRHLLLAQLAAGIDRMYIYTIMIIIYEANTRGARPSRERAL
jgi:hypothetical protein